MLRAVSVSSTRITNLPPSCRAFSQLKSAVRAPPTWSEPVGDGANRVRISRPESTSASAMAIRAALSDACVVWGPLAYWRPQRERTVPDRQAGDCIAPLARASIITCTKRRQLGTAMPRSRSSLR